MRSSPSTPTRWRSSSFPDQVMAVSAPAPSIPAGEHVQLSLPHVGLLPATVSAIENGAIMLVLAVKDSRVQRLAGAEVAVEYKTGRGIQRFSGILQLDS